MADSSIAGLFLDPYQYLQQQNQAVENQAMKFAQLSPMERATASIYSGANRLGGALAGAMGVEDPMLQQMSIRKKLASQFDTSSASGLIQLSQALREAGDMQGASQVAQQALLAREKEANIQAKLAEKLTPEQRNAAALADSQHQRGTPEWQKTYKTELARLTAGNKGANIKEIGVAEGSREPVYFDVATDTQFIMKSDPKTGQQMRVPFNGGVDRTTSKSTINMPAPEAEFLKGMAQEDVKRVSSAITARNSAIEQLQIAERLQKTSPEALSGQFANTRAGMVNFLDTIGLTSPADKKKLLASQSLTADSSRLVLAALNNKLGGGVSNQDAKRIEQIFPQLENSPEARAELINIIIRSSQGTIEDVNRLEQYARSNRGLQGYKLRVPNVSLSTPASQMTTEQLKAIAGIK